MIQASTKIDVTLVSDRATGGAAIACRRLQNALGKSGRVASRWVAGAAPGVEGQMSAADWPPVFAWLLHRVVSRLSRNERILRASAEYLGNRALLRLLERDRQNIIHLHGIHDGMSFGLVDRLVGGRRSVVWTLHDMWPLTGYCYYSYACPKYSAGCQGDCPEMGKCGAAVLSPAIEWRRRERVYNGVGRNMVMVAPSRWLADCAQQRFCGRLRVECIPYGLDLSVFRPCCDRLAVRKILGLPVHGGIVLAGADDLRAERKGGRLFQVAMRRVASNFSGLALAVAFGSGYGCEVGLPDMRPVGIIKDEALLALYYSAADVFVSSSLADNLPNTIMESIACGTPVVAFDVGGCRDMVREGQTGFLVPNRDVDAMGDRVLHILKAGDEERNRWRAECRRIALTEYSSALQAQRYERIYEELAGPVGA